MNDPESYLHVPQCEFYGTDKDGYDHVYDHNGYSVDGEPICDCGRFSHEEIMSKCLAYEEFQSQNDERPWSL